MATYKVLEKSYIDGRIVEAGEIIEYEGKAGKALEPVKKGSRNTADNNGNATGEDAIV